MANKRGTVLQGISEFGIVVGGVDTKLGTTEEDGFELIPEIARHRVRSGQSRAVRKSVVTEAGGKVTVRLQDVDAINLRDLWGLPTTELTGDLNSATPTAEVLKVFASKLGTEQFTLYAIGDGPVGPRRVDIPLAVLENLPRLAMSAKTHTVLEATFEVLEKDPNTEMWKITDNL